ncbi:MAG: B12-binding domain-containing radical SAM protein [Candidatus Hodarchaeota archaeon]
MILLINPKTTKPTEIQTEFFREPNLGILYLAAVLDQNDIYIDILDLEQYQDYTKSALKTLIEKKVKNYNVFGITALTNTFNFALNIAKVIKNCDPNNIIVFGGPHVSFQFEEVLNNKNIIDFICVGESENSFLQLSKLLLEMVQNFKTYKELEQQLKKVKGIAYKNSKNQLIFTGYPEPVNLERLPLPARYKLGHENYYYKVANIIINRGCPYQCSFCSRQKLFKKIRIRSINSILSEIQDILSMQTYNYINFYDNINIDNIFFKEFCRMFIDNNINIPWGCELRVDNISEEDAHLLKEAGCKLIATGIESASRQVLEKNLKYQEPDKAKIGIQYLKQEGISIQAYFILGLPGETQETFHKTIEFIKGLPFDENDKINYFLATPYPGSRLWDEQEHFKINIFEKDFTKYDCQHIIFETEELNIPILENLMLNAKEIESYFQIT